jgi:hypothetical protein
MLSWLFQWWFLNYTPWVNTACQSHCSWIGIYIGVWILMWMQYLQSLVVINWIDFGFWSVILFIFYRTGPLRLSSSSRSLWIYYHVLGSLPLFLRLAMFYLDYIYSWSWTILWCSVWLFDGCCFIASLIHYHQLQQPYRNERTQQQQIQNCVSSFL